MAYREATYKLGEKQKTVYDTLRYFPDATNAELAARLGWPINRVTPRIKELRGDECGYLVYDGGKRKCKVTGSTAHAWKAKHPMLPEAFPEKPKVDSESARLI